MESYSLEAAAVEPLSSPSPLLLPPPFFSVTVFSLYPHCTPRPSSRDAKKSVMTAGRVGAGRTAAATKRSSSGTRRTRTSDDEDDCVLAVAPPPPRPPPSGTARDQERMAPFAPIVFMIALSLSEKTKNDSRKPRFNALCFFLLDL